jgi:hypothetical protein
VGSPLWREDGSVFCMCRWSLPAQSFSGPSPLGLATLFYCLRFETSIFVAYYDTQGHGGGIRPRLHMGPNWSTPPLDSCLCESESQSYVMTDGQSASLSWYKAPIWAYDQIFIAVRNTEYVGQLWVCWYGALSLTRGQVCRLQLLLALTNAVILGSESPWDSRPYFTVSDLRLRLSGIVVAMSNSSLVRSFVLSREFLC